jgi:hypothetical protein
MLLSGGEPRPAGAGQLTQITRQSAFKNLGMLYLGLLYLNYNLFIMYGHRPARRSRGQPRRRTRSRCHRRCLMRPPARNVRLPLRNVR